MALSEKTLYEQYLMKHAEKQNKGAKHTRDSERLKCYRAEWAFQNEMKKKGNPIPTFSDLKEAQKSAKKIYKSKTWPKLYAESGGEDFLNLFRYKEPKVVLKQKSSGRGNAGHTDGYSVTLDKYAGLDAYTLIHELTHCLGHMHHGRSFRKALLRLVGTFLGAEYKKELKSQFKKRKLAFGEARKPMPFEQWKEMRQRMEKLRNG